MKIIIILISIIGGIAAFWWLGLLLLIILSEIWMPLLILLGLLLFGSIIVLAFNKSKQSKKHKKYILASVFTILFLFVIVTIVKNTITYPIIINSYDGDKIKKYTEKLISDSYENKKESVILFANLKFGMTPKDIINNVIKNGISKTIYFNDYTPSKIIIGNTSFETDIKYYFDSTNKLRGIEIKCKSNEELFEDEVVKYYGKKYLKRDQLIWLFNNARVRIKVEDSSPILEIFDISDILDRNYGIEFEKFEEKSYNGKIIGDEYIKSPADEGRDSIVELSFLGFTLGKSIEKGLQQSKNISNLKREKFEGLVKYTFNSRMIIDKKSYYIECIVKAVDGIVGHIDATLEDDIYDSSLLPLYQNKYGGVGNNWKYRNQQINISYNENTQIIPQVLSPTAYIYSFKNIIITYSDYNIENKISILESNKYNQQIKQKAIQDSSLKAKQLERMKNQRRKESYQI